MSAKTNAEVVIDGKVYTCLLYTSQKDIPYTWFEVFAQLLTTLTLVRERDRKYKI